jgi:hypothetical protein
MESIQHRDHAKLRKAFAAAYRKKENAAGGDLWRIKVMAQIRTLGPFYPRPDYLDLFQGLIWRLVPAACVLLLLLGLVLSRFDFMTDYVAAKMFTEDPANYSLLALL